MWFLYALIATLCWGTADLFYKKGSDENDKLSHLKIVVMVGLVMGIHGAVYMTVNHLTFSITDTVKYFPVSALYILSMTLGYVGLRYIELSVSSPVQNSSGAVASVLCIIFLKQVPSALETAGIVLITAGLLWLAVEEKKVSDKELKAAGITPPKKYTVGIGAFMFPILYCIIDGLGTFADALYLNEQNPILSEDSALLAYEFTFFVCALIALFYIKVVKKADFKFIDQKDRALAAVFETAGQVAYVFVIGGKAMVAAPMIASYCVVSVILSSIFLKERLSKKQYIIVLTVIVGIALLAATEGL